MACAAREAGVVVGLRSADVPALNATHALSRKALIEQGRLLHGVSRGIVSRMLLMNTPLAATLAMRVFLGVLVAALAVSVAAFSKVHTISPEAR